MNIFPPGHNNIGTIGIIDQSMANNNYFIRIRWTEIQDNQSINNAVDERCEDTRDQFVEFYQYVRQMLPANAETRATIHIDYVEQVQPLRDIHRGVAGGYPNPQRVQDNFLNLLKIAIDNILTSNGRDLDLGLLEIEMTINQVFEVQAGTSYHKVLSKAIHKNKPNAGLHTDIKLTKDLKDCCGWVCILQLLSSRPELRAYWQGQLNWLTCQLNPRHVNDLFRSPRRVRQLVNALKTQLEIQDDIWNMTNARVIPTIDLICQMQPKIQIIVFMYETRKLIYRSRGVQWSPVNGEHSTIQLVIKAQFGQSHTVGHMMAIKSAAMFFTASKMQTGYKYCVACFTKHHKSRQCSEIQYQCDRCGVACEDADDLQVHKKKVKNVQQPECQYCKVKMYNEACLNSHMCPQRYQKMCEICDARWIVGHVCGAYKCRTCDKMIDPTLGKHVCYIQQPFVCELEEDEEIEAHGQKYYFFDFESMFELMPNNLHKHTVNLVCVKQCFTNNEWSFNTIEQYLDWAMKIEESTVHIAHNMKGYDGRLLLEAFAKNNIFVSNQLMRGSKILKMSVGKITFADSLLHFGCSLEQLPKMFAMEEDEDMPEIDKGFCPYTFNVKENQNYIGPFPDRSYYDIKFMKLEKLKKFNEWYPQQQGKIYNHQVEQLKYCRQDVRIGCKAIEKYLLTQMKIHPIDPFDSMTIASYALKVYRTYHMPENSMTVASYDICEKVQQAMHGGRVDVRRMLVEYTDEEIANGIYARYQDVSSLYPTVQFYDPLPCGEARLVHYNDFDPLPNLDGFFGFVCCDMTPPEQLHHPVIVEKKNDKLMADLEKKYKIVVPTPEYHLAVEHGYIITRVYYTIQYDQRTDLFKSYFQNFLKGKIQAAGIPDFVKTDDDWQEFKRYHEVEMGIILERENMIKNPSLKTACKLLCNSLWGKFAETAPGSKTESFEIDKQFHEFAGWQQSWLADKFTVQHYSRSSNNRIINVQYKMNGVNFSADRRRRINLPLAAFITSHARTRLWKQLHLLGDRVIYHDTDSVIYTHNPNMYNIPEGHYLGEWMCETGGVPITKFASTGPKCYAYVTADGKEHCKIKGITMSEQNGKLINFNSMKDLILKKQESITTENQLFKWERGKGKKPGAIYTGTMTKDFKVTYTKGVVDPDTKKVYPIGGEPQNYPDHCQLWH